MVRGRVAGGGALLRATVLYPGDDARQTCERDLIVGGVPLPLMHRLAWQSVQPATATWFIAVREDEGRCRFGASVQVARSRALPGHLLLRVERLDPAIDFDASAVALGALTEAARRRWPRVLRASVELYSRDADARKAVAALLRELGFRRADQARMYRRTAIVDLNGSEDDIFARLHKTARRNVRAVTKGGVEVRAIVDRGLGPRMDALIRDAFARTGGMYHRQNWEAIIDLSAREPDLSHVAGLFRTGVEGPESLLAFEWACMHGDHAQSLAAGSTRPQDTRVALAYALVWDVIRWARARGARYLDFGGLTAGTLGSGDRLGGISDFKRSFGASAVEVGDEWTLEPHQLAARLAAGVNRAAALLRRVRPS